LSTRINQEVKEVLVQSLSSTGGNVRLNQEVKLLLVPASLSALQVQIIGGPFQDALGNPLSNGYLVMQLQHDAVALNSGQIMGNVSVHIPLDINGRIQGTVSGAPVFVWPNSALLPAGGNYLIWAYTSIGQLAWDNPQVQVVGSANPFNVNTWIPGP
jgi:hypothetical protein